LNLASKWARKPALPSKVLKMAKKKTDKEILPNGNGFSIADFSSRLLLSSFHILFTSVLYVLVKFSFCTGQILQVLEATSICQTTRVSLPAHAT
jgi:hypothetical protein